MEHLVFWRVTTYLPVTYDIAMYTPQLWLYNAISYSIRNFLFTPHYSVIDYSLQFHGNLIENMKIPLKLNSWEFSKFHRHLVAFHEYSDKLAAIYATELAN